jgi:acyl-CoA synthetase (AMP-forming)/AMP-acid ligase II
MYNNIMPSSYSCTCTPLSTCTCSVQCHIHIHVHVHNNILLHARTHYHWLFYSVLYEEFIQEFKGSGLKFEQVPFNHPMFIMYSSGTTGTPKCMVHSVGVSWVKQYYHIHVHVHVQCTYNAVLLLLHIVCLQGTLIQHLKEHILHGNMTSNDIIFYYSTVSTKLIHFTMQKH